MNLNLIAEALHRADSELSAYATHRPLDKREAQAVSDLCRRAVKELPSLAQRLRERAGKAQEWSTSKDAGPGPEAPSSEGSASCANPLDADEVLNRIRATTWDDEHDRETFSMSRPAALELLTRLSAPAATGIWEAAKACMDVVRDKCSSAWGSDYFIPEFERILLSRLGASGKAGWIDVRDVAALLDDVTGNCGCGDDAAPCANCERIEDFREKHGIGYKPKEG